ncbi:hypothetical protein [Streptomyces sp. NPDC012616]|uniref:hypothetical protein n=1 Tax=Streptomyces sp. NPDC012616 TaxID=3364840 RepID=UPI0036E573E6
MEGTLYRTCGDSYDATTVRAAPTAACAERGMRLLDVPDQPGEPARTAVSPLGDKRVAAEEVAAVQVDATGPVQYPRGAEQVADAADTARHLVAATPAAPPTTTHPGGTA